MSDLSICNILLFLLLVDEKVSVHIADQLEKIVVCCNQSSYHLWIRNKKQTSRKLKRPPKQNVVEGVWYNLIVPTTSELLNASHEEADMDICHYSQVSY